MIAAALDWASNEGFPEFMRQLDYDYSTAHQWRQRYLVAALGGR